MLNTGGEMRALKWVVCFSFILTIAANSFAQAEDIEHKYGIELRGGYGSYLDNSDPNTTAQDFDDVLSGMGASITGRGYDESTGAITGGVSLLYKSKDYFGWHIGLNVLGTDEATATALDANNQEQAVRTYMNAVEIFLTGNYYWHLSPRFNLQIGAGPTFYFASLDLEYEGSSAQSYYGEGIYGAHGRSFGFMGSLGGEFFLSNAVSLKLGGGFRLAQINRFKYYREVTGPSGTYEEGQIVYWPGTFDTFEVNFSGAFAEIGLRVYFEPAAKWKQYD